MRIPKYVINWLLEKDNPPVRYLTLVHLLHKPKHSKAVQVASSELMNYQVTQTILNNIDNILDEDDEYKRYWKYTGMYWQLIFLGQFLANATDQRVQRLAESILSDKKWINQLGGQCLTANLLRAFIKLGYFDHPVVHSTTESLAKDVIINEGVLCEVMEYSLLSRCYMAIPKLLLCFAEIPENQRSNTINAAIEVLVQQLNKNEVYKYVSANRKDWVKVLEKAPKRSELSKGETVKAWIQDQKHQFLEEKGFGERMEKKGWLKFGFPLHYNSDILETMYALTMLNRPNAKLYEAPLDIIEAKMTSNGTWLLENSLNGKMISDVEEKGKPSKWITLFALRVLNHFETEKEIPVSYLLYF